VRALVAAVKIDDRDLVRIARHRGIEEEAEVAPPIGVVAVSHPAIRLKALLRPCA
jgi:hypothetical protein